MKNKDLLTVFEFANKIGFSKITIYRYIDKGMPVYRSGKRGHIRINSEEAIEWLKKEEK